MDREKLLDLISQIDREVPTAGAQVKFLAPEGRTDESEIVANELGYLRLGIEFLKAGTTEAANPKHPGVVAADIDYLVSPDSDISFQSLERREDVSAPPPTPSLKSRAATVLVSMVFIAVVIFLIVGVAQGCQTVVNWVVR